MGFSRGEDKVGNYLGLTTQIIGWCSPTEEQDPHPAGDLGLLRSCCRLLTES